eukprot:scaffold52574_cov78-Phaeocystis_antarctica.AAC.4
MPLAINCACVEARPTAPRRVRRSPSLRDAHRCSRGKDHRYPLPPSRRDCLPCRLDSLARKRATCFRVPPERSTSLFAAWTCARSKGVHPPASARRRRMTS